LLVGLCLGPQTSPSSYAASVNVDDVATVRPQLPIIPDHVFKLTDFGAVGDGRTMNTDAFRRAIKAVATAGGGHLVVPSGEFVTGPFELCSRLELHVEDDAIVRAPDTFEAQGLPNPSSFKSQAEADAAYHAPEPLISGKNLHDVALTGRGTIDGNGAHWWAWSERAARAVAKTEPGRVVFKRPHLVVINGCERLLVRDLLLTNSPMFHLVPRRISELTIDGVRVRAPVNAPNTDAIDPGPVTNAWIHHCDIDTGDDDIVIKSGGTHVLIEDCTIKHGHGISIGSETTVGVHHLLVRRCAFEGTDNGIRIKSMRGAGGPVENVRYTDITMKNVANAIVLQLDYVDNNRPNFRGDPTKIPSIHDILIDHVVIEGARNAGIIHGIPESPITDITLRDLSIIAENDFDVKDATDPIFERVTRTLKPGVGPKKLAGEH
jgi:polygalacturonase